MIKSLKFQAGSSAGEAALEFEPNAITIFVGPNHSGKSQVIQEIRSFCAMGAAYRKQVLEDLVLERPAEPRAALEAMRREPNAGEEIPEGYMSIWSGTDQETINVEQTAARLSAADRSSDQWIARYLCRPRTLVLEGSSRLDLGKEQQVADLMARPTRSLHHLILDDERRTHLFSVVREATGQHLGISPVGLGKLQLRLAPTEVPAKFQRSLGNDSLAFWKTTKRISTASDGVRAFAGILTEVYGGKPKTVLIDEPEAFLHPALAQRLGLEMAKAAREGGHRLVAATHSPQFLMGCVSSGVPMNIVRLTYGRGVPTARLLGADAIIPMMRNPLLRSTGLLQAIFYEAVVVAEADSDRAFYQEINTRLQQQKEPEGVANCLFINAQNKQTVPVLTRPLRDLGIPTASIVDIDVLKDGGKEYKRQLHAAAIPEASQGGMQRDRANAKELLKNTEQCMKRDGGVGLLDGEDRQAVEDLLERLAKHGLFVVPGGELESWLRGVHDAGHGTTWLIDMFEKMGEDPSSDTYVHPAEGDVWDFMRGVAAWLRDPNRRGIPA